MPIELLANIVVVFVVDLWVKVQIGFAREHSHSHSADPNSSIQISLSSWSPTGMLLLCTQPELHKPPKTSLLLVHTLLLVKLYPVSQFHCLFSLSISGHLSSIRFLSMIFVSSKGQNVYGSARAFLSWEENNWDEQMKHIHMCVCVSYPYVLSKLSTRKHTYSLAWRNYYWWSWNTGW